MPIIIDEKKMIDDNMFNFQERVLSKTIRFGSKTPTFVEYYHINTTVTTVDPGFSDVENILGPNSPIKFNVIHDFPLYGMDDFVPQISDTDIGIDTTYEGEATILPASIKPLQNDYFIIKQLHDSYVFRITSVEGDTAIPDNFWKINFILEYIDDEKMHELNAQTIQKSTCVLENYGTDESCIIEDSLLEDIQNVEKMYGDMVDAYVTDFYNPKYNCILGEDAGSIHYYDPFQSDFIINHQLFSRRNQIDNLVLNDQFYDNKKKMKYEKTIYRLFETRNKNKLTNFPYFLFLGTNNKTTIFSRWYDKTVYIVDISKQMDPETNTLLSKEDVDILANNYPTKNKYMTLMAKYLTRGPIPIPEIDLTLGEEILDLDNDSLTMYFFTPIILFILKESIKKALKQEKEKRTNM